MALERPSASQPGYGRRLGDPVYWGPYVTEALRRHRLPADHIEAPFVGTFPTFLAGAVVVKLFGDSFDGGRSFATELAMHELLAAHREIPAPALVAHGSLYDTDGDAIEDGWTWPYLITERLDGVAIRDVTAPTGDLVPVAEGLGQCVRALQQLDVPPPVTARDLLPDLRKDAPGRLARFGLPRHLVDQVDDFLADGSTQRVLVHADITEDHAFVAGGRLRGIIDWGDAFAADPWYELVAVYLGCLRANAMLFARFLDAAEWPRDDAFPRRAMQAVLEFQFDAISGVRKLIDLAHVRDLDELADRLFGGSGRSS